MNSTTNNLFESIDILISNKINKLKFDRTVQATVIEQKENNQYLINFLGAELIVDNNSPETEYKHGDRVYVKFPNNNQDSGYITHLIQSEEEVAEIEVEDVPESASDNILKAFDAIGLNAGTGNESITPVYTWENIYNMLNELSNSSTDDGLKEILEADLELAEQKNSAKSDAIGIYELELTNDDFTMPEEDFKEWAKSFHQLMVSFDVETLFNKKFTEGNFGVIVEVIKERLNQVGESMSFSEFLTFDCNDFDGNYYEFEEPVRQYRIFDLGEDYENITIRKIVFFQENFAFDSELYENKYLINYGDQNGVFSVAQDYEENIVFSNFSLDFIGEGEGVYNLTTVPSANSTTIVTDDNYPPVAKLKFGPRLIEKAVYTWQEKDPIQGWTNQSVFSLEENEDSTSVIREEIDHALTLWQEKTLRVKADYEDIHLVSDEIKYRKDDLNYSIEYNGSENDGTLKVVANESVANIPVRYCWYNGDIPLSNENTDTLIGVNLKNSLTNTCYIYYSIEDGLKAEAEADWEGKYKALQIDVYKYLNVLEDHTDEQLALLEWLDSKLTDEEKADEAEGAAPDIDALVSYRNLEIQLQVAKDVPLYFLQAVSYTVDAAYLYSRHNNLMSIRYSPTSCYQYNIDSTLTKVNGSDTTTVKTVEVVSLAEELDIINVTWLDRDENVISNNSKQPTKYSNSLITSALQQDKILTYNIALTYNSLYAAMDKNYFIAQIDYRTEGRDYQTRQKVYIEFVRVGDNGTNGTVFHCDIDFAAGKLNGEAYIGNVTAGDQAKCVLSGTGITIDENDRVSLVEDFTAGSPAYARLEATTANYPSAYAFYPIVYQMDNGVCSLPESDIETNLPKTILYNTNLRDPIYVPEQLWFKLGGDPLEISSLEIITENTGFSILNPDENINFYKIVPSDSRKTECCVVKLNGTYYFTIILLVNRYGNEAINGWDGEKLEIDKNGQHIFTPTLGAGIKNNNNQFSGVVMGKDTQQNKTGIYGYKDGKNTFRLTEDGNAFFEGTVYAGEGYIGGTNGWQISTNTISHNTSNSNGKYSYICAAPREGSWVNYLYFNEGDNLFLVDRFGHLRADSANITGNITATSLTISPAVASSAGLGSQLENKTKICKLKDEFFYGADIGNETFNGINKYNNASIDNISFNYIASNNADYGYLGNPSVPDITKAKFLRINKEANKSSTPGFGGFKFAGNDASANAMFLYVFTAKIPKGYRLSYAANNRGYAPGTEPSGVKPYEEKWLTSNEGTGEYFEYKFYIKCGSAADQNVSFSPGQFSSIGYFYVYKPEEPISGSDFYYKNSITWYLSSATYYQIYDGTLIDGGSILANSVTANQINGQDLKITGNGEFEGKITANSGYIGGTSGWTIESQTIKNGTPGSNNSMLLSTKNNSVKIAGVSRTSIRFSIGSNFGVNNAGTLYANNAKIVGDINATSGKFSNEVLIGTSNSLIIQSYAGGSGTQLALDKDNEAYFAVYKKPNSSTGEIDLGYGGESYIAINNRRIYNTGVYAASIFIPEASGLYLFAEGSTFSDLGGNVGMESANKNGFKLIDLSSTTSEGYYTAIYSVEGQGAHSGYWTYGTASDQRLKNSITPFTDKYDTFFDKLQPCSYKYNDYDIYKTHWGLIAQDVFNHLDSSGFDPIEIAALDIQHTAQEDDYWQLNYTEFIALNTWQIQKAKARISELETRVSQLENLLQANLD